MHVRSIRTRLALWYLTILALILCLFAGGVYFTMRKLVYDSPNDTLQNLAFLTQRLLIFDSTGRPSLNLPQGSNQEETGDNFQRVFGADGRVLFDNSQALGEVPVDQHALERALAGHSHTSTVGSGDAEARVLTLPIEHEGRFVGALQLGESTADLHSTLNNLLLVFAIALPAALLLASLGGLWLSSRALAPIDKITRAAQDISEHDLSRRLGPDIANDEVGRLAQTFDGMIARLDAAFRRQRQFTADASHELRTPLAAIRGQIDVALQRPRDAATYQQVLATINDQVERMTRLVGGLLVLARTDAGALAVERNPVDVGALVRAVADQVRSLGAQKGLTLDVRGEGNAFVNGDDDLLLQMLLNLADNAVKYTQHGSITLSWQATGGIAQIAVADTGPGIAPEQRDRIFERFYRVDVGRSRNEGGAGLGLAICRWIAEAHGGSIDVTSSERGSTFTVRLPQTPSSALARTPG
jgi:heavy metal sensor kinase